MGQLLHEVGGRRASRSLTLHAAFAGLRPLPRPAARPHSPLPDPSRTSPLLGLHALPAGCPPGSDQRGAALLAAAREAAGGGAELDESLLVRFGRSSGGARVCPPPGLRRQRRERRAVSRAGARG